MSFLNAISVSRDDLLLVVRLAALTDDRAPEEHRALVRIAAKLDNSLNHGTLANIEHRLAAGDASVSRVLDEVAAPPEYGSDRPAVPKSIRSQWQRTIERYLEACNLYRQNRRRVAAGADCEGSR